MCCGYRRPSRWRPGLARKRGRGSPGKPSIVSREKIREGLCAAWTCDTARARAELGFVAETDLEHGLAKTLAWYKEAGWLNY